MEIRTFVEDGRVKECRRFIGTLEPRYFFGRLFLLPIPTTRDRITIAGTDMPLASLLDDVKRGDAVAGYGIPENIKPKLRDKGVGVYDGAYDEELLLRNAEVTARGTVGYILTKFDRDITDLRIGIIGYGRIGAGLLRYLLFLGATVTVFTTRESVARELCESGVNSSSALDGLYMQDVLVNTAPAKILLEKEALEFMKCAAVIDLASGNYFPESENLVKLSSIPARMYPVTAGRIYAEQIAKFLSKGDVLC